MADLRRNRQRAVLAACLPVLALTVAWQVRRLDIDDPGLCLKIFRANRDAGALIAASFLVTAWLLAAV